MSVFYIIMSEIEDIRLTKYQLLSVSLLFILYTILCIVTIRK